MRWERSLGMRYEKSRSDSGRKEAGESGLLGG